jgi:ABC-type uncharacterized transport system YnjBCD ATPase subunit
MIMKLTIDRFEGDQAVLKTEDNATIIWPKEKLPKNANAGSVLLFAVTNDVKGEEDSKKLAKDILNEILTTDDGK